MMRTASKSGRVYRLLAAVVVGGNAAVFGMVGRQAATLSFNATFWLLTILFVAMVPFIVLMGCPASRGGAVVAH